METLDFKLKRKKRIKNLIAKINQEKIDMQCIGTGFLMSDKSFTFMLKDMPFLQERFSYLINRKHCLTRMLWKLP